MISAIGKKNPMTKIRQNLHSVKQDIIVDHYKFILVNKMNLIAQYLTVNFNVQIRTNFAIKLFVTQYKKH